MATDKIIAMQAFVRVVQTGTFTKAAESLGMEKSQVSRLVQLLETQLSTKLLTRTTRRMMLTTEGAQYF
ncbi:MAG TPA: LysR family transcriptional regulator, partial [Methylibium sp.]